MHSAVRHQGTALLISLLLFGGTVDAQLNPPLQSLASEVFRWRAMTQPCMPDDIPRVERPAGWVPDCSPASLRQVVSAAAEYRARLDALPRIGWSRADSVDYLLVRSVLERTWWEHEALALPRRNPQFYVQQTLGALWEQLIIRPPVTPVRIAEILRRLRSIPATLVHARTNLDHPVRPFARIAIDDLKGVRENLRSAMAELASGEDDRRRMLAAADTAAGALEEYAQWLAEHLAAMTEEFHVGREAYRRFLSRVALIPLTPEEMLQLGRVEFSRAATLEAIEARRSADLGPLPVFPDAAAQVAQCTVDELAIRRFLSDRRLLTIPPDLPHYTNAPMPAYLRPLAGIGEMDDLASPLRLTGDAVRYIPAPSPSLSFFPRSMAQDPRPIIIHEGIPGHYFQLALSWQNGDPVRRQYIDSGPNEGWGFYVEEMLLQMGVFDSDRPQSRSVIYRFMRLRALRVEADVRLALGDWTIADAAGFLAETVPMDMQDALQEAAFFASTPGQAITYQIGKSQIQRFLADARAAQGRAFDLRAFHDHLARNGNVPISLLRWEMLGLADEMRSLW
jgi:uncharacterized protein (DUF885 family)